MAIFEFHKDTRNRAWMQQGGRVPKRNGPKAPGSGPSDPGPPEDWIAGHLRRVRNEALREEIPERMRALIDQLDRLEKPEEENPP
jgi:hypothetical protein